MKRIKHWQDGVNMALGAVLILAPWVGGYLGETTASVNAIVVGALLIAVSLGAMLAPQAWEEWTESILGLWMLISPWALAYSSAGVATVVAVVVGTGVIVMALWTLATDGEFGLHKAMLP